MKEDHDDKFTTDHVSDTSLENQERIVDIDHGYDPEFIKRTIRKIDLRLIPMLSAMYAVSLIDRVNLSYARAANSSYMDKQLGTGGTNNRYR